MIPLERACREAVIAAYRGRHVSVSAELYRLAVRARLVEAVRVLVEDGDEARAEGVMDEILRLDLIHGKPQAARRSA